MATTKVTSGGITDATIATADIADGAVTNAKIASGISASKITGLATDSITEGNSTAEVLDTGTNGIFRFLPEGVEKFRIDTNGKVGIGVAFPSRTIDAHVTDSGANYLHLTNSSTGTGDGNGIFVGLDSAEGGIIWNQENAYVRFGTNDSERMRIDGSGNVGIGTTGPGKPLDVAGEIRGNAFIGRTNISTPSEDTSIYRAADNTLAFGTAQTERMRISSTGKVGINTDNNGPDRLLHVSDSNQAGPVTPLRLTNITGQAGTEVRMEFECGLDEVAYIGAKNAGSDIGPLMFATASSQGAYPTEKARLSSNGNWMVGTTSSSVSTQAKGISLNNDGAMISRRDGVMHYYKSISTGGYYALQFYSANTAVGNIFFNSGGTQFNTSSDYRRKENIVSLTNGISKLKQLKTYNFNFKDNPSETVQGFLAHEAQEVIPYAVTGTKDQVATAKEVEEGVAQNIGDPIYQTIDHSKLVPLLTASLQELETRVAALEAA